MTRGVRASVRNKSEKVWNAWKDMLFNEVKVWKWGFVKSKKVWNQIKIWTLTSLYVSNEYMETSNLFATAPPGISAFQTTSI